MEVGKSSADKCGLFKSPEKCRIIVALRSFRRHNLMVYMVREAPSRHVHIFTINLHGQPANLLTSLANQSVWGSHPITHCLTEDGAGFTVHNVIFSGCALIVI